MIAIVAVVTSCASREPHPDEQPPTLTTAEPTQPVAAEPPRVVHVPTPPVLSLADVEDIWERLAQAISMRAEIAPRDDGYAHMLQLLEDVGALRRQLRAEEGIGIGGSVRENSDVNRVIDNAERALRELER